jgi:hypothetical protein
VAQSYAFLLAPDIALWPLFWDGCSNLQGPDHPNQIISGVYEKGLVGTLMQLTGVENWRLH